MGRIIVAVSGRVGHFVMVSHRYPQSKVDISRRNTAKRLGGQRRTRWDRHLSAHSEGQLSLIQRVRLSSLTSPAARERMMAVACAGSGPNGTPFLSRKAIMAMKAIRLLPSTKARFFASPNA